MILTSQGQIKIVPSVPKGLIIAFYGTLLPEGWAICDGTLGTPDLTLRVLVGDTAVGTGTAGGTQDAVTGLTHSGFALTNHSDHSPTQPSAHSAHSVTQPSDHSNHTATQPATHPTHSSEGAHTHDAHTTSADGSAAIATNKLVGPATHSSDGAHTHDAHPAHSGWGVNAHSAHSGFAVDAHSAHSGFAVDAHSAHGITQADTHLYKVHKLAYIMKL